MPHRPSPRAVRLGSSGPVLPAADTPPVRIIWADGYPVNTYKHDALAAAWAKQSDELKSLFVRIEQLNRANLQRHIAADRRSIVETYYPGLEGG